MYTNLFHTFKTDLQTIAPQLIKEILSYASSEKIYGVAFVTTDDFYGMYLAFSTKEALVQNKYGEECRWFANEWKYSDQCLPTDYSNPLYKNLISILDHENFQIDLLEPSPEKWAYAQSLMDAIAEVVVELPESIFNEYGYSKDEIIFLATMSDGDYMDEMIVDSVKKMNSAKAVNKFSTQYPL